MKNDRWAAVAVTKPGRRLLEEIHRQAGPVDIWVPNRLLEGRQALGWTGYAGSLAQVVSENFGRYRAWIFVLPAGAAVRLIAPWVRDKRTDPSVTVVDDGGQHAICLLSCHHGQGNQVTLAVARILGAQAVITTGSEVLGRLSVDLLGREWGWEREPSPGLTEVSRLILEGEPVAVVQESGERQWAHHQDFAPWVYHRWEQVPGKAWRQIQGCLWITHRREQIPFQPGVTYHPKVLILGIGVSRGTPEREISALVERVFEENHLALQSVAGIATIDIKKSERGLTAFAEERHWPVQYFSAEELNRTPGAPSPSHPAVYRATGARAVAEPAALRASAGGRLLVPKTKTARVTLAVALQRKD